MSSPKSLIYRFLELFFLENALNFGLSRFFKTKIGTCPALGPKTDGQLTYLPFVARSLIENIPNY
jgi:hypothetical protein